MKILVYAAIEGSSFNATTLHPFSLADFWHRDGHDVRIVIPEPQGGKIAYPLEGKDLDVQTRISARSLKLPNATATLLHLPSLLRDVWADGFDVIYIRMNISSFFLIAALRLFTNAIIVTEHNGWLPDELPMLGYRKFWRWIAYYCQSWDSRLAHLTRVVTKQTYDELVRAGAPAERLFVGENGTDLERMKPISRDSALSQFGLQGDKRYIGFLGNLAYWQGVHVFIGALAICLQERDDWHAVIAGDGIERENLEALAREKGVHDKMHFLGGVPLEKANAAVNVADICVAPYTGERNLKSGCSPIKIRDYAAAARPVVATNFPAVAEFSSPDWLRLFEADNEVEFAAKLTALMDDEELRHKMGEAARAYAEENFSWEGVTREVISRIEDYKANRKKR